MTMQINSGGSYSTTGSDEIDKLTDGKEKEIMTV